MCIYIHIYIYVRVTLTLYPNQTTSYAYMIMCRNKSKIMLIYRIMQLYGYTYGVISKIPYPEPVANALSLRIYRTPPCKFNCPSRPKIQKNNM